MVPWNQLWKTRIIVWGMVTWNQLWKTRIIVCCFSVDSLQCDTGLFVTPLLVEAEEHILPYTESTPFCLNARNIWS